MTQCNYCCGSWRGLRSFLLAASLFLSVNRCVVPEIVVETPLLDFQRCFLNYPYQQEVLLTNPSTLPVCCGVLDQVRGKWNDVCMYVKLHVCQGGDTIVKYKRTKPNYEIIFNTKHKTVCYSADLTSVETGYLIISLQYLLWTII